MIERCDYYSDDEYEQALQLEQEHREREEAMDAYFRACELEREMAVEEQSHE